MEINFEKLSKNSNRVILDVGLKLANHIEDTEMVNIIKKMKPTSLSVTDRILLEKYVVTNKKIVQKL